MHDISLHIATLPELEYIEHWMDQDSSIAEFATDSFVGDYEYYVSNPVENKLNYRYVLNDNVWILLAKKNTLIVGYLILFYDKTVTESSHKVAINPIVVNPDYRNQGIATSIITSLVDKAQSGGTITTFSCGCMRDNTLSIKLLTKLGFKIISDNNHFIEFEKSL